MNLEKDYPWVHREMKTFPRMLQTAASLYGTVETPGPGNNPSIMTWAKSLGLGKVYTNDGIPWCGLTIAYVAKQSGWDEGMPVNPLGARNWLQWGVPVDVPMLGDVLVFWRGSKSGWSGHVGWYLGESDDAYLVLGGNQGDKVCLKWLPKNRLLGARRCNWKIMQPASVRRVMLKRNGSLSTNEA